MSAGLGAKEAARLVALDEDTSQDCRRREALVGATKGGDAMSDDGERDWEFGGDECPFCGCELRAKQLFPDCDVEEIYCPDCGYVGIE